MPRIVTLTLNPTVDLACYANKVVPTHKIRTTDERADPGGGGIIVARVLHQLGADVQALIMTGGATGALVEEMLQEEELSCRSLPIQGRTRMALNVHECQTGLEYRFVPEGPEVTEAEWQGALHVLENIEADWIVASGSLPRGVPADFYAQAAIIATSKGQQFVLDSSGVPLRSALGHGIAVLKVSLGELEFLAGRALSDPQLQEAEIAGLLRHGVAGMIAVSLGGDGAILATKAGIIRLAAPVVETISAVGAGDSFVAGLVWGLVRGFDPHDALALGIAAGTAAVTSYGTAQVRRDAVEQFHRQLLASPTIEIVTA